MAYSVILLGATGSAGGAVAAELSLQKDKFRRVAFLTPLADAGAEKELKYKSVGLERIVGDFSDPASYNGFEIVISAVGDDICARQVQYADAAFAGGVKHFIPGEYGVDIYTSSNTTERYFQDKLKVRKHLEMVVKENPTVGYTYVMTGVFMEYLILQGMLGVDFKAHKASIIGTPNNTVSMTAMADIGKIVTASATPEHLPSLAGPHEVRFCGETTTYEEVYRILGEIIGHKIDVTYISREHSYTFEEQQLAARNLIAYKYASALRALGFGGGILSSTDNNLFPEIQAVGWKVLAATLVSKQVT